MQSSKYLIAKGPTNWVEGLEKYYAEDEEKRRRHGELLRQRDAEALEIKREESPIRALGKLAEFSTTVHKALKTSDAAKKKKEDDFKLQAEYDWTNLNKNDKKVVTDLIKQSKGFKDLKVDYADWKRLISESTELSPQAKELLTTQHGGYLARLHEQMGFARLDNLPNILREKSKNQTGFQEEWDQKITDGTDKEFLKQFSYSQLADLGLGRELVANTFQKPLNKWLDTKGVISHLRGNQTFLTKQELDFSGRIDTARKAGNLTFEIQTQLTEEGYTKSNVVNRLNRLAKSGELTRFELTQLMNGELDPTFKFPGKTGKDLFSDEQWGLIESSITTQETAAVEGHAAFQTKNLTSVKNVLLNNPDQLSDQQLTVLRDQTLFAYENGGGDITSQEYKDFKLINPVLQSPQAYESHKKEWEQYFGGERRGMLLRRKEEVKAIPNIQLRHQLLDMIGEDEAYYRTVDLPSTHATQQTYSKNLLINSIPQRGAQIFNPESVLTGPASEIQSHLTSQRALFHAIARRQNPDDAFAAKLAGEQMFEQYMEQEGLNTVDDGSGNPAIGKLSATMDGRYLRWRPYNQADQQLKEEHTKVNNKLWTQQVVNASIHTKGNKDAILDTSGTVLRGPALIGMVKDQPLNAQGLITPLYTPELVTKAHLLGVQPGELYRRQLQAFVNDPNNAQVVTALGLQDKLAQLYTPDVDLEQAVMHLKDKDLIFKYKQGIDKMSYNDITEMQTRLQELTRGKIIGVQNLPKDYKSKETIEFLKAKWFKEGKWDGKDQNQLKELFLELQAQQTPK